MPIIVAPPITTTPTKPELKLAFIARVKKIINDDISSIANVIKSLENQLWNNKTAGMTPQDYFDSMEKDGKEYLTIIKTLRDAVNLLAPNTVIDQTPADKIVTQNPDGSVTVKDKI